ncbi:MAG: hypothetical protein KDK25_06355 [Leptospiraceae bacterium]|nr:hypothetical protein [Leptospiraceae bacterium]
MNYLIVGGKAVLGQQAILAIRSEDPNAWIVSTSSGEDDVPGADASIHGIDLSVPSAAGKIAADFPDKLPASKTDGNASHASKHSGRELRAIVYVPARGPVGKPVQYATKEEYDESVNFSVRPMLELMHDLKPEIGLWFSGFMWLETLMMLYGPMIYTKITMEQITLKHPDKLKCVRYGMFVSNSARGISILSQKAIASGKYPEQEEYRKGWKASGKKFKDFFASVNAREEESVLRQQAATSAPYRSLETEDLQIGVKKALFSEDGPIINVVGDWYWQDDSMPNWPQAIRQNLNLIDDDLESLLDSDS